MQHYVQQTEKASKFHGLCTQEILGAVLIAHWWRSIYHGHTIQLCSAHKFILITVGHRTLSDQLEVLQ